MEQVFSVEILAHIFTLGMAKKIGAAYPFGLATWWALKRTCRLLRDRCTYVENTYKFPYEKRIESLLRHRHQYAPGDVETVMRMLHTQRCILTGSAVLQAIVYGETYPGSDVDLMYNGVLANEFKIGDILYPRQLLFFLRAANATGLRQESNILYSGIFRSKIEQFPSGARLNTVGMRSTEPLFDLIEDTFDLSICMVAVYATTNGLRFWCAHPNDLVERTMRVMSKNEHLKGGSSDEHVYRNNRLHQRLDKYCLRGFSISHLSKKRSATSL